MIHKHFKTKAKFNEELAKSPSGISDSDICFIKDTGEIWTHGKFYAQTDSILGRIGTAEGNITSLGNSIQSLDGAVVKTTSQSLTTAQATQARTNIGAAAEAGVLYGAEDDGEPLDPEFDAYSETVWNKAQVLTDSQKTTARANISAASEADIENLQRAIKAIQDAQGAESGGGSVIEGYIRISRTSDPSLSYKHYTTQEDSGTESVFHIFHPCLVGNNFTGSIGRILHILQKTNFEKDIYGNARAIDGSEGDVMICNISKYYELSGHRTVNGTEFDVFLRSRSPFTWCGYESTEVPVQGESPDYCVSHQDSDGVIRMHSVYNTAWDGSYTAPTGVDGKFVYTQDASTLEITETYDSSVTLLGGAGGCHTTNLALYTGEQYAMNMNGQGSSTVPYFNKTARAAELLWGNMLAESGTFDLHNASKMGSGFCSNDQATNASDWTEDASGAKNGLRYVNKSGTTEYLGFGYISTANNIEGFKINPDTSRATIINIYRNPFKIMEAHRAVAWAIENNIPELTWFVFEGNKYKWRSVPGLDGPLQGEMTCVVWKMLSTKFGSAARDRSDGTTSIEGNRIDFLISVALYHGVTTQVSPSWWTSGLVFTEDSSGTYEAYMQRDQSKLLITPSTAEIDDTSSYAFETAYDHVATITGRGESYRLDYNDSALMMPRSTADKTGGGLHTYVGGYNWFTGGVASANKKAVRGFRRGYYAYVTSLSPLSMTAIYAPSSSNAHFGFGTCVQIVPGSI